MAVNLLNSSDYETARVTLDQSFAQWEANESAWQLESQINTLKQRAGRIRTGVRIANTATSNSS